MALSFAMLRRTLRLRSVGWLRIPLLASVGPTVLALDARRCVVRVKLGWWTKNHLGSMYFGALAIGADCAAGLLAVEGIRARKVPVSLVFKGFHAEFLKRPESDVYFVCEEGERIGALIDRVVAQGERLTEPVQVRAEVRRGDACETVAAFALELSLKPSAGRVL